MNIDINMLLSGWQYLSDIYSRDGPTEQRRRDRKRLADQYEDVSAEETVTQGESQQAGLGIETPLF